MRTIEQEEIHLHKILGVILVIMGIGIIGCSFYFLIIKMVLRPGLFFFVEGIVILLISRLFLRIS
jgi:hypothetical protein